VTFEEIKAAYVVSKAFLFTEILIKSNPFDVQAQTYSSF
jgi:hypothetical protein